MMQSEGGNNQGHKVSSSGAITVILFFFMPWVLVSCGAQPIRLSGWQLASGYDVNFGMGVERLPGEPVFYLVLLAAFAVLYLRYLASLRGCLNRLDSYGLIGLGAFPLFIMYHKMSGLKQEALIQGVYVEHQIGFWLTVLGFIGVVAGGVINYKEES